MSDPQLPRKRPKSLHVTEAFFTKALRHAFAKGVARGKRQSGIVIDSAVLTALGHLNGNAATLVKAFAEEKHPRGQPENAGEFASKEGGSAGDKPDKESEGGHDAAADYKANGTRAKAFKAWFGDWETDPENASKVVNSQGEPEKMASQVKDAEGRPLMLFHGTDADFDTFQKTKDFGFHFGSKEAADRRLKDTRTLRDSPEKMLTVYLSIKNPLTMPDLFDMDPGDAYDHLQSENLTTPEMEAAHQAFADLGKKRGKMSAAKYREAYAQGQRGLWEAMKIGLVEQGYDGVRYKNDYEGGESWIAFASQQVKSTDNDGQFNPEDPRINKSWDAAKHKRGQPGNAGQFGPGGASGGDSTAPTEKPTVPHGAIDPAAVVKDLVARAVKAGKVAGEVKDAAVKVASGTAAATIIHLCGGAPAVNIAGAAGLGLKKAVKAMGKLTKIAFRKMLERYGAKNTLAIVGSAQAIGWGLFLGAGIWIPCSSALCALPGAVAAETLRQMGILKPPGKGSEKGVAAWALRRLGVGKEEPTEGEKLEKALPADDHESLPPKEIERLAAELADMLTGAWRGMIGDYDETKLPEVRHDKAFDESKVKRGQPENAGEFASKESENNGERDRDGGIHPRIQAKLDRLLRRAPPELHADVIAKGKSESEGIVKKGDKLRETVIKQPGSQKPLLVFHGTNSEVGDFADRPTFFSPDSDYNFVRHSPNVHVAYVDMKNPYYTSTQREVEAATYAGPEFIEGLKEQGYDGIVYSKPGNITKGASGWGDDYPQFITFNAAQIIPVAKYSRDEFDGRLGAGDFEPGGVIETESLRDYPDLVGDAEPLTKSLPGKLASTQVQVTGAALDKMRALAEAVADEDLADDGIEEDAHITARWGLHGTAEDVARIVSTFGPVRFRLGNVSVFPGDEYDVLKVDVFSPDLMRLNDLLGQLPHTDTFPEYIPHATLAYLKPGLGAVYAEMMPPVDEDCDTAELVFSAPDKTRTVLPLAWYADQVTPRPDGEMLAWVNAGGNLADFEASKKTEVSP